MAKAITSSTSPSSWMPLLAAAAQLGEPPDSLRKKLERAAIKGADGVVEASIDGVVGRKFGRNWKLRLSAGWL